MIVAIYGGNRDTNEWAKRYGLRPSKGCCLHWLSKGRCGVRLCNEGHGSRQWMDHVTGWTKQDGQRFLLCQPYSLYDFESLIKACKAFDLTVQVHGCGWYGHGTVTIELRRAWNPDPCSTQGTPILFCPNKTVEANG